MSRFIPTKPWARIYLFSLSPSNVELDSPDARMQSGIKGRKCVLKNDAVVMLPTVRDDPTILEGITIRHSLREAGEKGIRPTLKPS